MSEGRKTQIVLLEWDDRKLDILVQPKLLAKELLDMVASHFSLKEKDYFGLAFLLDSGHYSWLDLEKRVLEHEFPSKVGLLTLYFAVRFYVDSICQLRDSATIEAFYLNARHAVFKGQLECDSETAFELAANVLQVAQGDYTSDSKTRADLKKLPVIPTSALKEHPSLEFCEERIIDHYQKLGGSSRGSAIVNYMGIVEGLETYGIHFYAVKDKKDIPWWLGISLKGLAVYDKTDRKVPRKFFSWKQLENLYYRDTLKKFSIEVHDPKRIVHTLSSFNLYEDAIREPLEDFDDLSDAISDPTTQVSVSRRTFGPGNVAVHTWFAATPQLTKSIWCMAVKQHQFYLDRKHSRNPLPSGRSMSEIAAELSQSNASLSSSATSDMSLSESSQSIPSLSTSKFDVNLDQSEMTRAAQKEMHSALQQRKLVLEETMKKKIEELKLLCLKEGELTGKLPFEYPCGPGENPPIIRRRIGTAFTLNVRAVSQNNSDTSNELSQLELEYDLQCKINKAAHILAKDKSVSKTARKQRLTSYQKSTLKLKDMEKKLNELRRLAGRGALKSPSHSKANISSDNRSEGSLAPTDSASDLQSIASSLSSISAEESPSVNRATWGKSQVGSVHIEDMCSSEPQNLSQLGTTDLRTSQSSDALQSTPAGQGRSQSGYVTSQVYTTQTQYRAQRFPTLSGRSRSEYDSFQGSPHHPPYGGSHSGPISPVSATVSNSNLYNVNTRRTSQYDSMDELETPTNYDSYKDSPNYDSYKDSPNYDGYKDSSNYESYKDSLKYDSYKDSSNYDSYKDSPKYNNYKDPPNYDSYKDHPVFSGNFIEDNKPKTPTTHGGSETDMRQKLSPPGLSSAIYMYGSLDRRDRGDKQADRGYPQEFCPTETPDDEEDVSRGYPQNYCPTESPPVRSPPSPGLAFNYPTPRNSSSDSVGAPVRDTRKPVSRNNSDSWKSPQYPASPAHSRRLHITVTDPTGSYRSDNSPRDDSHQQYSPRHYEGNRLTPTGYDSHTYSRPESPQPSPVPQQSRIVTMNKMTPHSEVSKPYETSDFYKYSERLRRQRLVEQYKQLLIGSENVSLGSNSSHHSSDSDRSYSSGHVQGPVNEQSVYLSAPSSPYARPASPSPYPHPMSGRVTHSHVRTKTPVTPTGTHVQYAYHTPASSPSGYKPSPHLQGGGLQTLRQTHYQPPQAMACQAVKVDPMRAGKPLGSPHPRLAEVAGAGDDPFRSPENHFLSPDSRFQSPDRSFHIGEGGSLADAFSEEMLKWYEDQDGGEKSATLV